MFFNPLLTFNYKMFISTMAGIRALIDTNFIWIHMLNFIIEKQIRVIFMKSDNLVFKMCICINLIKCVLSCILFVLIINKWQLKREKELPVCKNCQSIKSMQAYCGKCHFPNNSLAFQ